MLSLFDFQDLLSISFFDGDLNITGMVMYTAVLLVLFALTKKTQHTLIVAIPVTLVFSAFGVLSTDLMVVLIIVIVLALAFTARNTWGS